MAAVTGKNNVFKYEDIDVFTVPHNRMKELLTKVSKQTKRTDYNNQKSFGNLLKELSNTFLELKNHEEIENKCVMKILKRKLQGEALKKLLVHLHAHSHISDILKQVRKVETEFQNGICNDLSVLGLSLNNAVQEFLDEYVPHMREEEQIFQPMLMEFLPLNELHQIREVVLQLHQAKIVGQKTSIEKSLLAGLGQLKVTVNSDENTDNVNSPNISIDILPTETLAHIFSFLGPRELCRCAQVSKKWHDIAYTGMFWTNLHPCRWALGEWGFGGGTSDDCNCDCEPNYELMTFRSDDHSDIASASESESDDSASHNSDSHYDSDKSDLVSRESKILQGICRYVLPKVGDSVKTLILECGRSITNGLLFRLLSQCKNLEYLDVSQTIVSDLGLFGLFKNGCRKLKYLDVSGCQGITDKTLAKLSVSMGKRSVEKCSSCTCFKNTSSGGELTDKKMRIIENLRLSGCYKITDAGLRSLEKYGGLPFLRHLDLSGCFNVTSEGIESLVSKCPNLDMNQLYYCDNISTNSYDTVAGGCQNQDCLNRVCCRTGL